MKKSEFYRKIAELERPIVGDWADIYIEIAEEMENKANGKQEENTNNRDN